MKFITMTAVGALVAGAAHAGGIAPAPSEPLVMAPAPMMASTDWTGAYGGLSLGYGAVDQDGIDSLEDEDESFAGVDFDIDGDGAIGGVFAGYQYDFGSFVVGVEADLNAANLDFDSSLDENAALHSPERASSKSLSDSLRNRKPSRRRACAMGPLRKRFCVQAQEADGGRRPRQLLPRREFL